MSYFALPVSPLQDHFLYSNTLVSASGATQRVLAKRAQTWRKPQEVDHIALEFFVLADICDSSIPIFIAIGSSRS